MRKNKIITNKNIHYMRVQSGERILYNGAVYCFKSLSVFFFPLSALLLLLFFFITRQLSGDDAITTAVAVAAADDDFILFYSV